MNITVVYREQAPMCIALITLNTLQLLNIQRTSA